MLKKWISFFLACLLIVGTLVSCNSDNPEENTTDGGADSRTPAEVTEISASDLKNYTIIRAKGSSTFTDQLDILSGKIYSLYQFMPNVRYDSSEEPTANEILVGATNRAESALFLKNLRAQDYGYAMVNGKIVIAGYDEEHTVLAIRLFVKDMLSESKDALSIAEPVVVCAEYPADVLTWNGNSLRDWEIVYPSANANNALTFATLIADQIETAAGFVLSLVSDSEATSEKQICVGNCKGNETVNGPSLTVSGTRIVVGGADQADLEQATAELLSYLHLNNIVNKKLEITTEEKTMSAKKESLRVMSFNLRYDLTENAGVSRVDAVAAEILYYKPDVFGVQEDTQQWCDLLDAKLTEYTAVRYGQKMTNNNQHVTLYYRTAEFTLLESGTKWLSETPSVPNIKFSESATVRKMNYVVLERKSDGERFCYTNTHLENSGTTDTSSQLYVTRATARNKQITVLTELLADISQKWDHIPMIITGDFNTTPDTEVYEIVKAHDFIDTRTDALTITSQGTWNDGYYGGAVNKKSNILDYCFISEGDFIATDYFVATEQYNGMYTSDHFPIIADLLFS